MIRATLDFETRSLVDLTKTTTDRYAEDPSTEVLCLAVKVGDEPTLWWAPEWVVALADTLFLSSSKCDFEFLADLVSREDLIIEAHNAAFEIALWHHVMHKRHGLPDIPLRRWRCSAAKAAMHALPRSLKGATNALELPIRKDTEGAKVMMKICKPLPPLKAQYAALADKLQCSLEEIQPSHSSATLRKRWYRGKHDCGLIRWHEDPDSFRTLISYCIKDVDSEHCLSRRLKPLPDFEQEFWFTDWEINNRGLPIDLEACEAMIEFTQRAQKKMLERFRRVTSEAVESPKCYSAFAEWIREQGVPCSGVSAEAIAAMLDSDLPECVREALLIAQKSNKSSVAKYDALLRGVSSDGTVKGTMMYHGAGTGRDAGKLFQPQNLPRGSFTDTEFCIDLVRARRFDEVEMFYGSPMDAASTCIRGMIKAPEGKELIAADYSAVEGRVLAWLAGEETVLEIYREGKNPYCAVAAECFDVTYEEVFEGHAAGDPEMTKLRQKGKTGDLACGFGGGYNAVGRFAPDMPRQEAKDLVRRWRVAHPMTSRFWYDLKEAVADAVSRPGETFRVGKVAYKYRPEYGFLMCRLPSGRILYYAFPEMAKSWIGPGEEARKALVTPGARFFFGGLTIWADEDNQIHIEEEDEPEKIFPKGSIGKSPLWRKEDRKVSAWTVDGVTKKWVQRDLSHLILSENCTQAVARDLLMLGAIPKLEAAGYPVILRVHDETVSLVDEGYGSIEEYEALMCDLPEWAEGLPIKAEGWRGPRFRK